MAATRVVELIAERIRHQILRGELVAGMELPAEATLVAELGVSRPTLRESLRILETEGLVRIRRGRSGGATVLQPNVDRAAYQLGLVLQRKGTAMEDLARARSALEPVCASLCAIRPDHEEVAEVLAGMVDRCAELVDDEHAPERFPAAALDVHTAILDACGNTTISLLMEALGSLWAGEERRLLAAIQERYGYPPRDERLVIVHLLRTVVVQIGAGDAPAAQRAMAEMTHRSLSYWIGPSGADIASTPGELTEPSGA